MILNNEQKMKGAISYSLFGYDKARHHNSFDFNSYLRGMHICIRFNRILYPGWDNVINMDESTYNSPYKPIFDWHEKKGFIKIAVFKNGELLCRAMLERLRTVFLMDWPNWRYSHVICRDLDSISTYREAQMVHQWIEEDKALHCITDSVSHTIPMMGGMIGFRPGYVNDIMKITDDPGKVFEQLIALAPDINYQHKGTDQDFLNRIIYPKLCTNATEHFIKGRPHDLIEGNGRHYDIDKLIRPEVAEGMSIEALEETNRLAGHVGAAGFYESPTMKFLYYDDPFKEDYAELENMKGFEQIFYWSYREDLR